MSITHHAIDRCEERYGYRPSRRDADLAFLDIVEGRAVLLAVPPNGHEHWLVYLGPVQVRAVYAPEGATIITVLAPEQGAAAVVVAMRKGRVRPSFEQHARYERGEIKRRRTVWRERA